MFLVHMKGIIRESIYLSFSVYLTNFFYFCVFWPAWFILEHCGYIVAKTNTNKQ